MKIASRPSVLAISILFAALAVLFLAPPTRAANTISGTVYDKARNPLPDIDVELLDEYYRSITGQRQRTSNSGRYEFVVNNDGRYYVKVYAFRYDLMDDMHEVYIQALSAVPGQSGSSFMIEDFYLEPKKGGLAEAELAVIFAQEVPKEAKKLFDTANDQFGKKKAAEGIMSLVEAVKIYPDYYLALQRLTRELLAMGKYVESFQYSRRLVAVNPKSANGYYYMGSALRHLGKEAGKSAVIALTEAARLAPGSSQVLLILGKTEREQGDVLLAEKHLLAAKKLSSSPNPEIHAELSQLYANDMKNYKAAADELEQYVKASKLSDADAKATRQKIADLRSKAQT